MNNLKLFLFRPDTKYISIKELVDIMDKTLSQQDAQGKKSKINIGYSDGKLFFTVEMTSSGNTPITGKSIAIQLHPVISKTLDNKIMKNDIYILNFKIRVFYL